MILDGGGFSCFVFLKCDFPLALHFPEMDIIEISK